MADEQLQIIIEDRSFSSPTCDCLTEINKALQNQNGRLGAWIRAGRQPSPTIYVRRLDREGATPPVVLPAFCPFCGHKYGAPPGNERRADHALLSILKSEDAGAIDLPALLLSLKDRGLIAGDTHDGRPVLRITEAGSQELAREHLLTLPESAGNA